MRRNVLRTKTWLPRTCATHSPTLDEEVQRYELGVHQPRFGEGQSLAPYGHRREHPLFCGRFGPPAGAVQRPPRPKTAAELLGKGGRDSAGGHRRKTIILCCVNSCIVQPMPPMP